MFLSLVVRQLSINIDHRTAYIQDSIYGLCHRLLEPPICFSTELLCPKFQFFNCVQGIKYNLSSSYVYEKEFEFNLISSFAAKSCAKCLNHICDNYEIDLMTVHTHRSRHNTRLAPRMPNYCMQSYINSAAFHNKSQSWSTYIHSWLKASKQLKRKTNQSTWLPLETRGDMPHNADQKWGLCYPKILLPFLTSRAHRKCNILCQKKENNNTKIN